MKERKSEEWVYLASDPQPSTGEIRIDSMEPWTNLYPLEYERLNKIMEEIDVNNTLDDIPGHVMPTVEVQVHPRIYWTETRTCGDTYLCRVWEGCCKTRRALRKTASVDLWCSNRAAAESHFGHISGWNTSQVTSMSALFKDKDFKDNIGLWDVSNVSDMSNMFAFCSGFNRDISKWDVRKVVGMNHMFYYARSFNQSLRYWDVRAVRTMRGMFANAALFNQPMDSWAVQEDCDLNHMFHSAGKFQQDLATSWKLGTRSPMKTLGIFDGAGGKKLKMYFAGSCSGCFDY